MLAKRQVQLKVAVIPGDGIGKEVMPDRFDVVVGSNLGGRNDVAAPRSRECPRLHPTGD